MTQMHTSACVTLITDYQPTLHLQCMPASCISEITLLQTGISHNGTKKKA